MAKINPAFQHDIYKFLHLPIRVADRNDGNLFVERFLMGAQADFEAMQARINTLSTLTNPAKVRADLLQYLKDHVGFTKELNNITNNLSENDLRKLISLAVALWKQKGTERGYANIVRLFTGATARIFNWFDFRMIVGEKAFGEEQLGEDSWFISVPGVEGSEDPVNTVVSLLTMEQNSLDRSLTRNHGVQHGPVMFFQTPGSGFPQKSNFYAKFLGTGVIVQPHTAAYDLSGSFGAEAYIRTTIAQAGRYLVNKRDASGKGFALILDTIANSIEVILHDGTNTVTHTFVPVADLDDGTPRHVAMVVDRVLGFARIWVGGTEASPQIALGALGDVSNVGDMVIGGEKPLDNPYEGDMDNFRLSLNAVYPASAATIVPPVVGFIEFIEEQLDEYFSDVRIVDNGSLNKTLILRILNLMRPTSERLNVIFIDFFDDFVNGVGLFESIQGSISLNVDKMMELAPNTIARTSVLNDNLWKDIALQVKANDTDAAGSVFGILFFVQDVNNFYEFRLNTTTKMAGLWKRVAGVYSQIGADVLLDIVAQASYIYTITTSFKPETNETLIQTHLDSNQVHQVFDSSFTQGKFGMKSDPTKVLVVEEVEMFQFPLDVQQVLPGFNL